MIEEEAWTEIGSNAHRWGKTRKEMTCRSRAKAEESRIDGFLVNKEALPLIHDFYVEKDEKDANALMRRHKALQKYERCNKEVRTHTPVPQEDV